MTKFNSLDTQAKSSFIDKAKSIGRSILTAAQRLFNRLVKTGQYDLGKEIRNNEWYNMQNGGREAANWFRSYATNPDVQVRRKYMEPGKLYMFVYDHPKYADVLDWYDCAPLVLSLGYYIAKDGSVVSMGVNMHHLPLEVRFIVLETVFKAFAAKYKGEMYRSDQAPVNITWQQVASLVMPFGAAFAFRSYLPPRMTGIIEFKYEDWPKAIFIPSNHYEKLTADQIFQRYMQYLRDNNIMFAVKLNRMI